MVLGVIDMEMLVSSAPSRYLTPTGSAETTTSTEAVATLDPTNENAAVPGATPVISVPETVATAVSLDMKRVTHVTSLPVTAVSPSPPNVAVAVRCAFWYNVVRLHVSIDVALPATMVPNVPSDTVISTSEGYHTRRGTTCEKFPCVTVTVTAESPLDWTPPRITLHPHDCDTTTATAVSEETHVGEDDKYASFIPARDCTPDAMMAPISAEPVRGAMLNISERMAYATRPRANGLATIKSPFSAAPRKSLTTPLVTLTNAFKPQSPICITKTSKTSAMTPAGAVLLSLKRMVPMEMAVPLVCARVTLGAGERNNTSTDPADASFVDARNNTDVVNDTYSRYSTLKFTAWLLTYSSSTPVFAFKVSVNCSPAYTGAVGKVM